MEIAGAELATRCLPKCMQVLGAMACAPIIRSPGICSLKEIAGADGTNEIQKDRIGRLVAAG